MDDRYRQLELNNVSDYIPIVNDIITNYCIENGIKENDILPNIWNDILIEINSILFKDNPILKVPGNINNQYNQDTILEIYNSIYKRICLKHNKVISVKAFTDYMLGISRKVAYEWFNQGGSDIVQIIKSDNEASLEGLLHDKSMNPMKVLPSLNHWHGWNEGSGHVTIQHQKAQNVSQLPNLKPLELSDNKQ